MSARADRPTPNTGLGVVYQCPDCEARYLDERRCPDCHLFCRRLDLGGLCPQCDEPVTLNELTQPTPTTNDPQEVTAPA